ncbi:sugar phosphate nucleotidyltransferase [Streptomyces monashensis]|uniref:sugar phosphate nucleotidyltransferase n=1 Tax=Streptomyces monashensis TaxID=1678012 RepID=UPI0033DE8C56
MPVPIPDRAPRRERQVLILGNGFGRRLGRLCGADHKLLIDVGGVTLFERILTELEAADPDDTSLRVWLRHREPLAERLAAQSCCRVEFTYEQPTGRLSELVRATRGATGYLTLIDSDRLTPPGALSMFLRLARSMEGDADICLGVTNAQPGDEDDTRYLLDKDGAVTEVRRMPGKTPGLTSAGYYHWHPDVLRDLKRYARGTQNLTTCIGAAVECGVRAVAVGIAYAANINTVQALASAREAEAAWSIAPTRSLPTS